LHGHHVDAAPLAQALSPYAAGYGADQGSGESFLIGFLEESGVPQAARRTIELAAPGRPTSDRIH
jgi:hypothetical protein